jgi:hypothetical protein
MSANRPSDSYFLGRSEAETQRLIRQAQNYGSLTRQFLATAGITVGMKVLDVGRRLYLRGQARLCRSHGENF